MRCVVHLPAGGGGRRYSRLVVVVVVVVIVIVDLVLSFPRRWRARLRSKRRRVSPHRQEARDFDARDIIVRIWISLVRNDERAMQSEHGAYLVNPTPQSMECIRWRRGVSFYIVS